MPAPRNALRPHLETLEARAVPHASFGVPWADPSHLTVSFAPDGTGTPKGPSDLAGVVDSAADRREVLRALQTWASVTNVNIGLVGDGGVALGAAGAVQGDARFGDLRVAASSLTGDVLASASPFSWTGTTFSGDVIFNTDFAFGAGQTKSQYDLYSVALHEFGHSLGLGHDDAAGSVMNETYATRTGLSAGDVAAIRAIYGPREPDANEGRYGNDSFSRATPLRSSGLLGRVVGDGDLTTSNDVDTYSFATLPTLGLTNVTVRLQAAGLSLLTGRVSVYNAAGSLVARSAATDPLDNDVSLTFPNGFFGGTYAVKVDGASGDVFDVGAYRLTVDTVRVAVPVPVLNSFLGPVLDGGLNETVYSATDLSNLANDTDARFDATFRGAIERRGDVDVYKVVAPQVAGNVGMNVLVWATDGSALDTRVRVYDQNHAPVAFRVVSNDDGLVSVEIENVFMGKAYYVSVAARDSGSTRATGSYFLGVDFNQHEREVSLGAAAGTVASAPKVEQFLITDASILQFALAATGANGAFVTLSVRDAAGRVVLTLETPAGQPLRTKTTYLPVGTYTATYTSRGSASPVSYDLFLDRLSDDVGTYATKTSRPAAESSSTTADSGYSYGSSSSPPPSGGRPYTM